ncbi:hypothetical protein A9Q99_05830 [Gammaproteobacteria bacterium 45_16_T64]|nr:hypothetical protein A9Q99_05830 [Gammaproteobacteria bacterium 45_16_T64]
MSYTNHYVKFIKRPESRPTEDVFEMAQENISELKSGEFLLKNVYLSLDPAMVGRMREESNYADSVEVGGVMHCYGIGQVIESKNPKVSKGELRMGQLNMQEYTLSNNPEDSSKINVGLADPTWYLSVTGITGMTAYFAMRDICQPKSGETIVISAGASSVGMIAAQLAKKAGCRVVAIVSTDEKAEGLRGGGIYDDAVSYRNKDTDTLTADLTLACPGGVDMYFDNTSGDISEALLDLYNDYSRIAVIGRLGISHLPDTRKDVGRRDNNVILAKRISKQGMVLLDYKSQYPEAIIQLSGMVHRKEIRFEEDMMHGIEKMPTAFFRVLDGKNKGKQLVKVGDINSYDDPSPVKIGQSIRSKKWLNGFVVNALRSTRTVKSLLPMRA